MRTIRPLHLTPTSVGLAILLPLMTRGSFVHAAIVFIIIALSLLGLAVITAARVSGRWRRMNIRAWCLAIVAVVIAQSAGMALGVELANADELEGVHYCQSLIPRIEAIRRTTGRYPSDITIVPGWREGLPKILEGREEYFYAAGDTDYTLRVPNQTIPNGPNWTYISFMRGWSVDD